MHDLIQFSDPRLVNTLAHLAGVIIFSSFLYFFWRDRRRRAASYTTGAAAGLALAWNLVSVILLAATADPEANAPVLVALSFSLLSLLPAVLFQISLAGRRRWLALTGYAISGGAVLLHLVEPFQPAQSHYHDWGLWLITIGFGLLSAASVLRPEPEVSRAARPMWPRLIAAAALFLFAMSFAHLSTAQDHTAWTRELAIHHAGIPLVLFVLLQDYRFLFLDVFLRFLLNASLAAALTITALYLDTRFHVLGDDSPVLLRAAGLAAICGLLIVFAPLRDFLQSLLTRVGFRRSALEESTRQLREAAGASGERDFLDRARLIAAQMVDTDRSALHHSTEPALPVWTAEATLLEPAFERRAGAWTESLPGWCEVIVGLGRQVDGPPLLLLLGPRAGGRRYLSEDLHNLSRIGALIVEQVDRIRQTELERLASQAELRALQAQINPHFLFNALNTLYGIIPRNAADARATVLNLSEIFRYLLMVDRPFIELAEELRIARAYLAIEQLRLGARLETEFDIDEELLEVLVPVLSIQPLVENAVKHGIAPMASGGRVRLSVRRDRDRVVVCVEDSGRGFSDSSPGRGSGKGLENVRQRLRLSYGKEASLTIRTGESGTSVTLTLPGRSGAEPDTPTSALREPAGVLARTTDREQAAGPGSES